MKSFVVAGLGFGDEGKGTMVDWLVREHGIKYVCRYNGAFQAAHNVVTPEGIHHTFSQFGSGTLAGDDVQTILFGSMIINPLSFLEERKELRRKGIPTDNRVLVSGQCRVATPFHAILNRVYETCRGNGRHGSCGRGVGLTARDDDPLFARDLEDREHAVYTLRKMADEALESIRMHKFGRNEHIDYLNGQMEAVASMNINAIVDEYRKFCGKVIIADESDLLAIVKKNSAVFEGAQGVLLDERHGFFPHVTKSNTTFENALDILSRSGFDGDAEKVGVLRAYHTRHGHGPFPSESIKMTNEIEECHNGTGEYQGTFRSGSFDAVLAKYALDVVGGVDKLAITCVDKIYGKGMPFIVTSYEHDLSDGGLFSGSLAISNILVNGEMTSGDHEARNKMLNGFITCGDYVPQLNGDESVGKFIMMLSQRIGRKIDIVSVSPTHLGKMHVNEYEHVKDKEFVNG